MKIGNLIMQATISILEAGNILLDCLNESHDYHVEIDTKDVWFLRLNLNKTIDIAFLLDKDSVFIDALKSNEHFITTELNNDKLFCRLNKKAFDLEWTILGRINNFRNLPDSTYPYFICVKETADEIVYINMDKVSFVQTYIVDYAKTISITRNPYDDNKMIFYKSNQYSEKIDFAIDINCLDNKENIHINIVVPLDEQFVKMVKQQINHPYRIKDKTIKSNLLCFLEAVCPMKFIDLV